MHNILRQLFLIVIFACSVSTQSISSEKIKSFFSNSALNIESSSLEIIDSEKKAIFKGQNVQVNPENFNDYFDVSVELTRKLSMTISF